MRLFLLLLLCGLLCIPPTSVRAQSAPAFVEGECIADAPVGRDVECGRMRVPLDHFNPNTGTALLPIMIVRATERSTEVPLFLLQGGPGGDSIDTFAFLLSKPNSLLPTDRDIIFYEQRGTTNAKPSLDCPENHMLKISLLNDDISYTEATNRYIASSTECIERLRTQGIDFSLFNSDQNARDAIYIAEQLGHRSIDLYGVSYGSLLAQHITRLKPELIRSLVIDGIVPPNVSVDAQVYQSRHTALNALFTDCESDDACARAFPQLRQTYADVLADYRANPRTWTLTDSSELNRSYEAIIDDHVLQSWMFSWLYDDQIVQFIPLMIHLLADNQIAQVRVFGSFTTLSDSIAEMMYMSTQCSEESAISPVDYTFPKNDLFTLADGELENDARYRESICALSGVPQLNEAFNEEFRTKVPTLIVSGRYDPITPANFGDTVARSNPHATHIIIPSGAHGAMLSNACAANIAKAFWQDPTQTLDTVCVGAQRTDFLLPNEVIETAFTSGTAQFTEDVFGTWIIIGVALMLFLIVLIVRLIRTILHIWQRTHHAMPSVVRQQKLLQSITSLGGVALISYIVVRFAIQITTYDYALFMGISDQYMLTRLALWGFFGLTIGNAYSAITAIKSGHMRWQTVVISCMVCISSVGLSAAFIASQLY